MEYVYTTYLLEQAQARGTLVVNRPGALRDANEKLYTAWFPRCMPADIGQSPSFRVQCVHRHAP